MNALLVLPLVVPLLTAIAAFLAGRSLRLQRALGVAGAAAHLGAALALLAVVIERGILVSTIGGWPAPFGITLVADLLSAIMVAVAALIGCAVSVYAVATLDERREAFGFYALFHVLLLGVCGAFLSGDVFNFYVWFEVMLIASFVLLSLGGERPQLEGAIKYVTLNLLSSSLFLTAVGILYGKMGTLSFADLARKLGDLHEPELTLTLAVLFLAAFGIKAAVFPLFFWLPASYHTPPVAVSAILSGLLTKVGVYALLRVFTLLFLQDVGFTHRLILVIAALTMVTGVLGAACQGELRRILAFHIVSQIGYMIMGLGLFSRLALAGSVFYLVHHILVKTNLFLISGLAHRYGGSFELARLGGLYRARPFLAALFLVPAMSLAGVPPLSGFAAKLALVRAGLELESHLVVATALAVSLLTLFSMTKIWAEAFWAPACEQEPASADPRATRLAMVPAVGLALLTILLGLAPQPLLDLALAAADQLLDPEVYARAVLGEAR
ncbi:MAG TPA: Na+/H+ antiporter subunit D [Thermoanaerobaculia bacterium]|nr:Na+/H+ antiporter subunit D [Thermoanaerobaculia bacterium]